LRKLTWFYVNLKANQSQIIFDKQLLIRSQFIILSKRSPGYIKTFKVNLSFMNNEHTNFVFNAIFKAAMCKENISKYF